MPFANHEHVGVFSAVLSIIDSVMEIWGPLCCERAVLAVPPDELYVSGQKSIFWRLYRRGDCAYVDERRVLQYGSRTESQAKDRGHRQDVRETELHVTEIDGVKEVIWSIVFKKLYKINAKRSNKVFRNTSTVRSSIWLQG